MKRITVTSLSQIFAITLAVASVQSAQALADEIGIGLSDHCQKGDPLCAPKDIFEPIHAAAAAAAPHVKAPVAAAKPAPKPAAKPAAPSLPTAKPTHSGEYAEKDSPNGDQEIRFGDDGLQGSSPMAGTIRLRPKFDVPVPCFDTFWNTFKDSSASALQVKNAYAQMKVCFDSCVSEKDANFLASCVDWTTHDKLRSEESGVDYYNLIAEGQESLPSFECSSEQIHSGILQGLYDNTHRDEKTGQCPQPKAPDIAPVKKIGKKLAETFVKTRHCPANAEDYAELKKMAEDLLAAGGRPDTLPMGTLANPGNVACGYSPKHNEFISRALFCTDETHCFDQDRSYRQVTCSAYSRRGSFDRTFRLSSDCLGMQSFRESNGGESRGDLVLLPLVPGVWIQAYRGGMGFPDNELNYVGIVFNTSLGLDR